MSKVSEHIVIEPSGDSIDFLRKDYDTTQVWFQHPRPSWIANLLPIAISDACGGSDFTYSTFRRFPLRDPADFHFPNEGSFLIRAYLPIGGSFPATMWCCLSWFDPRRPPVVSSEKFHRTGSCLKRILTDQLAAPAEIDKLRKLEGRPRLECWVRHDWRAHGHSAWRNRDARMDGAVGRSVWRGRAAKDGGNASAHVWWGLSALRTKERAERDRKAAEEARALYAPAEAAAQAEARAPGPAEPANQEGQPAPTPAPQESAVGADAPPCEMTRDQIRQARENARRE